MPTTILASRYNTLRNNVNVILGISDVSAPSYGYGQGFSTSSVVGTQAVTNPSTASKVTAQGYEDLYIDLIRVRSHQVGAAVAIDEFVIGDYDTNAASTDKVEEAYVLGLESLATNITTDRLEVATDNLTITGLPTASSTRPNAYTWNGTISHIFVVTFDTDLERRHFFNTGGQVRISASVDYTGSQAKTVDWQTILNDMGSTSFKADNTVNNAGVGTGSNIGNYDLSTSYQQAYTKDGGAVYSRNEYLIYAKEYATGNSTSAIQFKVDFVDGAPNDLSYGVDEVVYGSFNSTVEIATPNSQIIINGTTHDAVVIDTVPTGTNIRVLS
jgi:hypothetical protein